MTKYHRRGLSQQQIEKYMDDLQSLFADNPDICIERTPDSISFITTMVDTSNLRKNLTVPQLEHHKFEFKHTVSFLPDGRFQALDYTTTTNGKIGKTGLSFQKYWYKGRINYHGWATVIGIDHKTGKMGPIRMEWNTADIKDPVKEYLDGTGLSEFIPWWCNGKTLLKIHLIGWGVGLLAIALVYALLK